MSTLEVFVVHHEETLWDRIFLLWISLWVNFFFYHIWQEYRNQMAQFAFIILLMRVQVTLLHQHNAMPLSTLKNGWLGKFAIDIVVKKQIDIIQSTHTVRSLINRLTVDWCGLYSYQQQCNIDSRLTWMRLMSPQHFNHCDDQYCCW